MVDFTIGRQNTLDAGERKAALTSPTFMIEAGGQEALFSELAGISSEVEQVEYMESGAKGPMFGRFLGRAKPPTVTLKRSMNEGPSTKWIWTWHSLARTLSPEAYRMTTLKLFAAGSGSDAPVKSYMLVNAVPTKVEIAGMKAGATEVVLQTLTLMCDSIEEAP